MSFDPRAIGQFTIINPGSLPGWRFSGHPNESNNEPNEGFYADAWWLDHVQPILDDAITEMKAYRESKDYTALPDGRIHVHIVRPELSIEFYGRFK